MAPPSPTPTPIAGLPRATILLCLAMVVGACAQDVETAPNTSSSSKTDDWTAVEVDVLTESGPFSFINTEIYSGRQFSREDASQPAEIEFEVDVVRGQDDRMVVVGPSIHYNAGREALNLSGAAALNTRLALSTRPGRLVQCDVNGETRSFFEEVLFLPELDLLMADGVALTAADCDGWDGAPRTAFSLLLVPDAVFGVASVGRGVEVSASAHWWTDARSLPSAEDDVAYLFNPKRLLYETAEEGVALHSRTWVRTAAGLPPVLELSERYGILLDRVVSVRPETQWTADEEIFVALSSDSGDGRFHVTQPNFKTNVVSQVRCFDPAAGRSHNHFSTLRMNPRTFEIVVDEDARYSFEQCGLAHIQSAIGGGPYRVMGLFFIYPFSQAQAHGETTAPVEHRLIVSATDA